MRRLALALMTAAAVACTNQPFTVDVPLRVVASSPSPGAAGVARKAPDGSPAPIVIFFSEELDPASVTSTSVTLARVADDGSTTKVATAAPVFAVAPSGAFAITLVPAARLDYSRRYLVTVENTVRRKRDGGRLPTTVLTDFRTEEPPALGIVFVKPSDLATGVTGATADAERSPVIRVRFSEPVDCDSVTAANLAIRETLDAHPHAASPGATRAVAGSLRCNRLPAADPERLEGTGCAKDANAEDEGSACVVTFTPAAAVPVFGWSSKVEISLRGGKAADHPLQSVRATRLGGQLPVTVLQRSRIADPPALAVAASTPASGATGVSRGASISLAFSEPIDCAQLQATARVEEVRDPHPHVPAPSIAEGTTGAAARTRLLWPAPPGADFGSWSCPDLSAVSPVDHGCGADGARCVATFTAKPDTKNPLAGTALAFEYSSSVIVTLPGGAYGSAQALGARASVESARATSLGGELAAPVQVQFRVEDPPALALAGSSPANGARSVGRADPIVLKFTEPVDCAQLLASTTLLEIRDAHAHVPAPAQLAAGSAKTRQLWPALPGAAAGGAWTCPAGSDATLASFAPARDPNGANSAGGDDLQPLAYSSQVVVTLAGAAYAPNAAPSPRVVESGRATSYGGSLPATVRVRYFTENPPALLLASSLPASGSTGVPRLSTAQRFAFNAPIDCAPIAGTPDTAYVATTETYDSLLAASFAAPSAHVPGSVAAGDCSGSSFTWKPDSAFAWQFSSSVSSVLAVSGAPIESVLATTQGGQLAASTGPIAFVTEPPPALLVRSTTPGPAASGAPRSGPISVTFSGNLACSTVTAAAITITEQLDGSSVQSARDLLAAPDCSGKVVSFTPKSAFALSSTIRVTLAATIRAANATTQGGYLTGGYSFSYLTQDPPPLALIAQLPSSGGLNFDPASAPTVQAIFSAGLLASSVTATTFFLNEGPASDAASQLAAQVTVPVPTKAALQTTLPLKYDTVYTATLRGCATPPCASAITSALATSRGGGLPQDLTWQFRTAKVPPQVAGTVPANGAQGVDPAAPVRIAFTQNMAAATVTNAANVFLSPGAGTSTNPVAATLTYDPAAYAVTLTPSAPLATNADYTINVTTNALATTGLPLPAAFQGTFRTRLSSFIQSVTPADRSTGNSIASALVVTFNVPMDTATITAASFGLTFVDQFGLQRVVPGAIAFGSSAGNTVATFTPSPSAANCDPYARPLRYATKYTVTLTAAIKSQAGASLLPPAPALVFTTGAPPIVSGSTPAPDDVDVPVVLPSVDLSFSAPMDRSTLTTANVQLTEAVSGAATAATLGIEASNLVAHLKPAAPLKFDTSYRVFLAPGTSGVRDAAGNFLDQPGYGFVFRTSPANVVRITPSGAPGSTQSTSCYDKGTYNSCPENITVAATFSRPIDPASISDASFSVTENAGAANARQNPGLLAVAGDRRSVIFVPAPALLTALQTVRAASGLTGVRDLRGNPLAADVTGTFGSVAGAAQATPAVAANGFAPATGAALAGDQSIAVAFDSDMHPARLTDRSLTLTDTKTNTRLAGTVTYDIPNRVARFTPSQFLRSASGPYRLDVTREATNLYLIGAVPASATYTAAATAPVVSTVSPANGATGVAATAIPVLTFSKNVDPASVTGATVTLATGGTALAWPLAVAQAQVTFVPPTGQRLSGGKTYTLTAAGVTDTAGNALATGFSASFTVDGTAPFVTTSTPLNNAQSVAPGAPLSLTFSKEIDARSVTASVLNADKSTTYGSVNLSASQTASSAPQVAGCFSFSADGKTLTFTPLAALAGATSHVLAATNAVADLGGVPLSPVASVAFKTQ